ncbi:hypothetical protein FH609_025165 [Streptomyces sp. 3MP-14]|uniref:Uncharacterized protein n=1 Tax=Streptomyces mimosae TaxID=2586635 RepID=A0A5N5ZZJ9_9ACTN|nr:MULTISPECIES: DUF1801 domain-containing protein [Streptomyces]KAB8161914.1 hypothetical protein FH607_022815 [Streptomyces mimosae]KAB8173612.1 hypothetical protein FH609_025165 [Streptomyces sp. 3MP-14]
MADSQKKTASKTTSKTTGGAAEGFTPEERAAMKERAKEVRASSRRLSREERAAQDEAAVVEKIAEMEGSDRAMAEQVHAIVRASAPELAPKLWYGMPAYARDGKVVCFFQSAAKFGARYATLGFNDTANLDEGTMWPTAFALTGLAPAEERRIRDLVRRAAG